MFYSVSPTGEKHPLKISKLPPPGWVIRQSDSDCWGLCIVATLRPAGTQQTSVQLARHLDGTKRCVVKWYWSRESFLREWPVWAQALGHRGVIKPHEVFQAGSIVGVTMDYIAADWKQARAQAPKRDTSWTLRLLQQLADAIDHLHSRAVIHGDLSPSNVRVKLAQSEPEVLLTDFGIAVSGDWQRIKGRNDQSAPEVRSEKILGKPSDIFSFGCLAYELLVGRSPKPLPKTRIAPLIPASPLELCSLAIDSHRTLKSVSELVMRCLSADPLQRPTIGQVTASLRQTVYSQDGWLRGWLRQKFGGRP